MTTEMHFQNIRFVLNRRSKTRKQYMEGRPHIVVPTSIMVEGVHNGNQGPLLYTANELAKSAPFWNNKPAVRYHPKNGDEYVSANDPDVLTNQKIGILLNSSYSNKLKTDVWVDESRTQEIDPRILEALKDDQPVSVSSGLFYRFVGNAGEWNGEPYEGIAADHIPDHLAILPDLEGACSIKDGAGMLVNEDFPSILATGKIRGDLQKHFKAIWELVTNEMSMDQLFASLLRVIRSHIEKYGDPWDGYIQDVFPKYVVYNSKGLYYKQAYKALNSTVELVGDPVVVVRVYKYETPDGFSVNVDHKPSSQQENPEMTMTKKQCVDSLITAGSWKETNRVFLNSLNDAELQQMVANDKNINATAGGTIVANDAGNTPVLQGDAWRKTVPAAFLNVFDRLVANENRAKGLLVNQIMQSPGNKFTQEFLAAKELPELEGIVELINGSANAAITQVNQSRAFVGNAFGNVAPIPMFQENGNGKMAANGTGASGTVEVLEDPTN